MNFNFLTKLAAAAALALTPAAHAQTLTLTAPSGSVSPGSNFTVTGTLRNDGPAALTLISGNITVDSGPGDLDADADPIADLFFNGTPIVLASGQSQTLALFTLDALAPTPPTGSLISGTYSLNLLDESAMEYSISDLVSFQRTVAVAPQASVPEPSSGAAWMCGTLGLLALGARKRRPAGTRNG